MKAKKAGVPHVKKAQSKATLKELQVHSTLELFFHLTNRGVVAVSIQ